jgi:N-sulfoglucosamine sulfohydrolase
MDIENARLTTIITVNSTDHPGRSPGMPTAKCTGFLVVLALFSLWQSALCAEASKPTRRPNIIWITAENISLDLGCYGEKLVHTPNLDRLAAEGMRYTRVFATSPVCAPSRSAFMTGMYQTTIDVHHMRCHRDDDYRLPPGVRPLTHRLAEAGYFTANVKYIGKRLVGTGKLDLNFVNEGPIFQSDDWSLLKKRQPFFVHINTPEVEYDIYDRKTRFKQRVEWVGEREHPQIATPDKVSPPPYYPDHPIVRAEWARYLNSVSGLDRRVGWILDALKEDGLADDTIVVFFADNGRLEPRGIHWCYDCGIRVPLIIRWPKNFPAPPQYKPGTVSDQVISLLDLTATTLSMAGIERPLGMHSRIFLGNQADPPRQYAFSARDRIDETVNRIRSVHDGRFHYIRNFMPEQSFTALNRYKEKCFPIMGVMRQLHAQGLLSGPALRLMAERLPEEELYDTLNDPHEIHNLADSPQHRAVLLRLRTALEVWMAETNDLGHRPEPPHIIQAMEREMHEWFGTPDWYRPSKSQPR